MSDEELVALLTAAPESMIKLSQELLGASPVRVRSATVREAWKGLRPAQQNGLTAMAVLLLLSCDTGRGYDHRLDAAILKLASNWLDSLDASAGQSRLSWVTAVQTRLRDDGVPLLAA